MAQYAQSSSNRYFLAELSIQMLPNGFDSKSRRKGQIGGGKVSGISIVKLDRMAYEGNQEIKA
jgi:hypothetical protein